MSIYDISVTDINGEEVLLKKYKDKLMLIVNTASEWGFKSQLGELEKLYEKYKDRGLVVLAFPSDQFNQEPLSNQEIKTIYPSKYDVHYPIFEKINVNGDQEHPLYTYLKSEKTGLLVKGIKWNYTKFLVDKTGKVVERYGSKTKPESFEDTIINLL